MRKRKRGQAREGGREDISLSRALSDSLSVSTFVSLSLSLSGLPGLPVGRRARAAYPGRPESRVGRRARARETGSPSSRIPRCPGGSYRSRGSGFCPPETLAARVPPARTFSTSTLPAILATTRRGGERRCRTPAACRIRNQPLTTPIYPKPQMGFTLWPPTRFVSSAALELRIAEIDLCIAEIVQYCGNFSHTHYCGNSADMDL